MASIRVSILEHTGAKKNSASMPDDMPVKRILPVLVKKLDLPLLKGDKPISYKLFHKNSGRTIGGEETLNSAGVKDDDILSIVPTIEGDNAQSEPLPNPKELNAIDDVLNAIADIRLQLEKLQSPSEIQRTSPADISEINERIESLFEQLKSQVSNDSARQYANLLEEVRQQQILVSDITAPVEIPAPNQMKVKLVPSHLLKHMEETRADENQWYSVAWAFVGAILGVIVNWVTSNQIEITRPALVVMATFAIVSFLAFKTARRYANRAEIIRNEMMNSGQETKLFNKGSINQQKQ